MAGADCNGKLTASPLPQKIRGTTSALKAAGARTTQAVAPTRAGGAPNLSTGPRGRGGRKVTR